MGGGTVALGVCFQQDVQEKKKTNCKIWEAKVEGVRSILKAFSGKLPLSLCRKAGGTELRLSCKALSLPLWHCGESADCGQEVRQHTVVGIQAGSRLGVNKCLHGRDRWGRRLQSKAAEKGRP